MRKCGHALRHFAVELGKIATAVAGASVFAGFISIAAAQEDRWSQFETQAFSFSSETLVEHHDMNAVRASGAGCVYHRHRHVAYHNEHAIDPLGAAWVSSDCSSNGAVVVTLFAESNGSFETSRERGSRIIVRLKGSDITTLIGPGPYDDAIQLGLDRLIASDPIHASALPAWPAGAITPNLAPGLVWESGVERDLYEAIRQNDRRVWCLPRAQYWMLECFADAPGRASAIDLLRVTGLRPYQPSSANDAIAILTGEHAAMSASAYEEAYGRLLQISPTAGRR